VNSLFLRTLNLVNFKSYKDLNVKFSPNVNCITGLNGIGKTNLLDAIYYLAFCKSFFNSIDVQNITQNEPFFVVQGELDLNNEKEKIYCGLQTGKKKIFKRNSKEYQKLSEHIGLIPLVMVTPSDTHLISDGSDARRKFIDGVISQYDKGYLADLLLYNRALAHRNRVLKTFFTTRSFDESTLEIWDYKLIEHGDKIHQKRTVFLKEFIPIFQQFYSKISGDAELVSLSYNTSLGETAFIEQLQEARNKDRAMRYTTVGIHKDDLTFMLADWPLRKFGSQGQQKTYVTALKLAQFHFMMEKKNIKPLLLLDDVFDKLDETRVKSIMNLVSSEEFGQIFVTDTSYERIERLFHDIKEEVYLFNFDEQQNLVRTNA